MKARTTPWQENTQDYASRIVTDLQWLSEHIRDAAKCVWYPAHNNKYGSTNPDSRIKLRTFVNTDSNNTLPRADERSLDPDDWEALRSLGHRTLDDMIDYLQSVRERPAWQPLPEAAKSLLTEPLPTKPSPCDEVYADIHKYVLPYPTNNIHPRFWSWVGGTGTATQLIADMIISAMNSASLGMDEVASSHLELQLLGWLKTKLDYPADASGILESGGWMAHMVGLAVAPKSRADETEEISRYHPDRAQGLKDTESSEFTADLSFAIASALGLGTVIIAFVTDWDGAGNATDAAVKEHSQLKIVPLLGTDRLGLGVAGSL